MQAKSYKGRIHNWEVGPDYGGAPGTVVVRGVPEGHPEFRDFIRTSQVVKVWKIHEHVGDPLKIEIETLNSKYDLIGEGKGGSLLPS